MTEFKTPEPKKKRLLDIFQIIPVFFLKGFGTLWLCFFILWFALVIGIVVLMIVAGLVTGEWDGAIAAISFLTMALIIITPCAVSMRDLYRLHCYLKNNKKELYESLLRDYWVYPYDGFPTFTINYSKVRFLKYMFDDSRDDEQSRYYKNKYRLSLIITIIVWIAFMYGIHAIS